MAMTGQSLRRHTTRGFTMACCLGALAAMPAVGRAATGDLTYDACYGQSGGCQFVPGNSLENASAVAVNPSGKVLYVTGRDPHTNNVNGPMEGSLGVFTVGAQGAPTYNSCLSNDGSNGTCTKVRVAGNPLTGADAIAVSPNGGSVYIAAEGDPLVLSDHGDVVHLFANNQTGAVTYDGCLSDDGADPTTPNTCTSINRPAFAAPFDIAVSPSGGSVYVASFGGSFTDSGVISHLFAASGGQLSFDGCLSDGGENGACVDIPGASSLAFADGLAVSPSGNSVFVSAFHSVDHLFANPTQGQVSWDGCISDDGSGGFCLPVSNGSTPFAGPEDVAVGTSGNNSVYAIQGGTVTHLFTDADGRMSLDGCISNDGSGGTCADIPGTGDIIGGETSDQFSRLTVSPDGKTLYAATPSNGTVSWFSIASPGGQLTFQGCVTNAATAGCTQVPGAGLTGADGVAVSPDGSSVYVSATGTGTLVHLTRATSDATTGTGTGTGTGGGTGGGSGSSSGGTATATVAGHTVTLSGLGSACVSPTAPLRFALSDKATSGAAIFTTGLVYVDRGEKAVRRHTVHRNGHRIVVKTTVFLANQTIRSLPANVSVRVAGLKSGTHTVRVVLTYTRTVHHRTQRLTKTLTLAFKVC